MKILNKDKLSKGLAYKFVAELFSTDVLAFLRDTNSVAAGGFFRDYLRNEVPKDLDIVTVYKTKEEFFFKLNYFDDRYSRITISKIHEFCYTVKILDGLLLSSAFTAYGKDIRIPVNITFYLDSYQTPAEDTVFQQFDFNVNMLCLKIKTKGGEDRVELINGFNKNGSSKDLIKDIIKGNLKINSVMSVWNPTRSISRLAKLIEKGFRISDKEKEDYIELIKCFI